MRLILGSGYPYPLPQDFDPDSYDSRAHVAVIKDVCHFEWRHTLTIEFTSKEAACLVKERSCCWQLWSDGFFCPDGVLEAVVSADDGYDHPAIVFGGKAYCSFMLLPDE